MTTDYMSPTHYIYKNDYFYDSQDRLIKHIHYEYTTAWIPWTIDSFAYPNNSTQWNYSQSIYTNGGNPYISSKTQVVFNANGEKDSVYKYSVLTGTTMQLMSALAFTYNSNSHLETRKGLVYDYSKKIMQPVDDKFYYTSVVSVKRTVTAPKNIIVYPNPARSEVNISGIIPGAKCDIVDVLGRVVISIKATTETERINVEFLKSGVYFLQLHCNGESSIFKMCKE